MATNFPSSLDTFTNPTATDTLDSPPHDQQHANINDAVEALEAKVGVNSSAVTTSIDYQLNTGYRYHSTLYFTSSGTFTKATYPWLRAIKVKVQAGGGGGGGAGATAATTWAAASGGQGGNYGEKFITDIAGLSASETITVGAGGSGGAAGANSGTAGGDSVAFGVTAGGGALGLGITPGTAPRIRTQNAPNTTVTGADLFVIGGQGEGGLADGNSFTTGGGGGSMFTGDTTGAPGVSTSQRGGTNAVGYGGGGTGGGNGNSQTDVAGGNGYAGIVIVELYA